MMKKRGAGNIEFILAFILFVSFSAAAIYFLQPTKSVQSLESARVYVTNTLIENASVELDAYSVIITTSDNEEKNIKVFIEGVESNKNLRVVNYSGSEINSKRDSNNNICFTRTEEKFVTLYFSEDLDEESGNCGSSGENNRIASTRTSKVISEKRILQLKEDYENETNYPALKEQFKIPANMDFSFSFEFSENDIISAERTAPLRREVFSDTQIKEILRKNGELKFGYLTVKVW